MRPVFLAVAALAVPQWIHANEAGYLVVDVAVSRRNGWQPTWIALSEGNAEMIHVPTGGALVELPPGRYRIEHIDFQEDPTSGLGTIRLDDRAAYRVDIERGKIRYFGLLSIRESLRRLRVRITSDSGLLARACKGKAEIFRSYPMVVMTGKFESEEVFVTCSAT